MPPSGLHAHICQCDDLSFRVPPSVVTRYCRYRNINLLSIDYAFRPRLRIRLTLGGITFPRKPSAFGDKDFHLVNRYSSQHNHFLALHRTLPSPFTRVERSPTPAETQRVSTSRGFGYTLESRSFSAQNLSTSELLRTL